MPLPVDLTNLREITDGDTAMEKELFEEFISTGDSYIVKFSQAMEPDNNETWRTISHSFKGIALNLGAMQLGELCKKAQENNTANIQEKTAMLESIKREYIAVRDYLNSIQDLRAIY